MMLSVGFFPALYESGLILFMECIKSLCNCDLKLPYFRDISIQDISWIRPLLYKENTRNADFSFINIFSWSELFQLKAANICDTFVAEINTSSGIGYSFPAGASDDRTAAKVIAALAAYTAAKDENLRILSLAPKYLELIEHFFPELFTFSPNTHLFDYIYRADKLASLSGKKLHSKRNHINRFISEYPGWSFEPLSTANLPECLLMDSVWVLNKNDPSDSINAELQALQKTIRYYNELSPEGGLLRIDGRLCAFTIAERLSSDTFVVHFEKALPDINGAYPMINREFVRYLLDKYPDTLYINREDDMGLENLRKAKRSYYPEFLVEKYTAELLPHSGDSLWQLLK